MGQKARAAGKGAVNSVSREQRRALQRRQNVARQLRPRRGEEQKRQREPRQREHTQLARGVNGPHVRLAQTCDAADEKESPRQRKHEYDRQVKIEGLRVVILVRDVAREVVLYEKLIHERPAVARDDGRVPNSRDRDAQRESPDDSYLARPLAPQKIIESDDSRRDDYADQPLRQQ